MWSNTVVLVLGTENSTSGTEVVGISKEKRQEKTT